MSYCSPLLQIAGQTSLLSPLNVLFHLSVLLILFPSAVKMLYTLNFFNQFLLLHNLLSHELTSCLVNHGCRVRASVSIFVG